jgi:hypothetical protein
MTACGGEVGAGAAARSVPGAAAAPALGWRIARNYFVTGERQLKHNPSILVKKRALRSLHEEESSVTFLVAARRARRRWTVC